MSLIMKFRRSVIVLLFSFFIIQLVSSFILLCLKKMLAINPLKFVETCSVAHYIAYRVEYSM